MIDTEKRKLVKLASLALMTAPVISSHAYSDLGGPLNLSKADDELVYVYKKWLDSQEIEPLTYIINRGVVDFDDKRQLKNLSVADFSAGNTLVINGFVLSMIEAAVLASLGKNCSAKSIKVG